MDPVAILGLLVGGLIILFFLGVPIYASFLFCNVFGLYILVGHLGFGMFVNSLVDTATSIPLVTLPLFILMGEILYRANAIEQLVDAVNTLVGRIHGRLYVLTVVISTILASLSGSAMASAAMLTRTVVPTMTSRGYDRQMTLGAAIGGACLAPIIPPSVLAIIVGTLAQVSIGALFTAGVVPGLMLASMFLVYIFGRLYLNPTLAPETTDRPRATARSIGIAVSKLLPFSLVIVFVMGSIITGFATPSESAAIGVVGSMMVAMVFRKLNLAMLLEAFRSTVLISGMIMIIMISSQLFSQLLAFSGTSELLRDFVGSLGWHGGIMLFALLAIPFVLCMFLDEIAAMLILIPIYQPLLGPLEFDPLWFWTLFLINISLGAIAPPVGYVLFVMQGILPEVKLTELFRAAMPYVVIFILSMVIIGAFPGLVTLFALK
jgi:tripartite ATP-independent transporter DctM subunit